MNLIDGLNIELKRAKELLVIYESIPTGFLGETIIRKTIDHAELSMQTGNTVELLQFLDEIKSMPWKYEDNEQACEDWYKEYKEL